MSSKRCQNSSRGSNERFKLRRNQLFGPYGIGAVVPCPDGGSLMISGLDPFPTNAMREVDDPRLAKHIGVSRLLAPPEEGSPVPASRFPRWLYCPICHTMRKCERNQHGPGRCDNPSCKGCGHSLIPERFIVVCPEGHVDDFPILEWVHGGPVSDPEKHTIKRTTKGGTASLADIEYRCLECGRSRTLAGATRKGALAEVGFHCKGAQPWLWRDDPEGCKADPDDIMVVQRGGTNVWYPDVFSSIYIPDGKDPEIASFVQQRMENLQKAEAGGMLDLMIDSLADAKGYDKDLVKAAYLDFASESNSDSVSVGDFREEEYLILSKGSPKQTGVFDEDLVGPEGYDSNYIKHAVECVGLVSTLRETRALVGFSRLYPDHNDGLSFEARRRQLSRNRCNWALGIQSTGEGIFLKFNTAVLEEWLKNPMVHQRFRLMQMHHDEHCRRQSKEPETLNPLYVLIHSFSHALMLALSKECGYSAASVRERIYCDKVIEPEDRHEDMLGLLVYTASSDSEGSLGGLVRAGKPGRLEKIIDSAISDASWCSSDPVCIQSKGQGPESCNLAACYSCALVPETSCENGNKLLDRALLVGTLEDRGMGLFSDEAGAPWPFYESLSEDDHSAEGENGYHSHSCQVGEEGGGCTVAFFPLLDEGYDMSQEGFASACKQALNECEGDREAEFVSRLMAIGERAEIEIPMYSVPFESGAGGQFDSALAWVKAKVALFVGDSAQELIDEIGEAARTEDGWLLLTAYGSTTPDDVAQKIAGA